MSTRIVLLASVCSAFLAASAAVAGSAAASPESSTKLASVAYKALQAGDAASAVQGYTQAIESRELEPEVLANALLNRGLAWQRLNEHERAIDDYTAAMRLDAMSGKLRALALYNRGLSYQKTGKAARAIEDYTSALFLDGQFAHAYYSRGTLLRDTGQHLFALADFDKALRFNHPDPARVHFAAALTYERLHRPQEARNSLTQALAANPAYEPARQRLALLDGTAPAVPSAPADQMATATIANIAAQATALPEAAAPSAKLLEASVGAPPPGEEADMPGKKYKDRVPTEDMVAAAQPAATQPAPEERVVAVEALPDAPAEQAAASEETQAPAPAEAEQKFSGWSVQLASATSEDAAWSTWNKMKARNKALAGKNPVVVRADLGTKGTFYRVRLVGFDSQGDANSACAKLKAKGVKCYISKASS